MPHSQRSKPSYSVLKITGLAMSFGLCLGLEIYLLGILLGGWLDAKFNTEPWCLVGGVLVAVLAAFRQLYAVLQGWQKRQDQQRPKEDI